MKLKVKYKLIIFDLDDTLFDYQTTEMEALLKTCKELKIRYRSKETYSLYKQANNIAKASITSLRNESDFATFRLSRAKLFLANFKEQKVNAKEFVELLLKHSEQGKLIPGVYSTLKSLNDLVKFVIGTNGSTYPRLNKVKNSKIAKYISGFYSSEQLGFQKPDPNFFRTILKDYESVNKKNVLVVGNDFNTDISGALNANIDCCYFAFKEKIKPESNERVMRIERFPDIMQVLKFGK